MFRVAGPIQAVLRVPPVIATKLVESRSQFLNVCLPYCTTTPPPNLNLLKVTKPTIDTKIISLFKTYYNVDGDELYHISYNLLRNMKADKKRELSKLLVYFHENNYKWEELREDKSILLLSCTEVRRRLRILLEFFLRPTICQIQNFQCFLYVKVGYLRAEGVILDNFDLIGRTLNNVEILDLPEDTISKIRRNFQDCDEYTLADIHVYILVQYLSYRFNVDTSIVKESFRINNLPKWKCLRTYCDICDLLIDVLKLDFRYVMSNPVVLDIDPLNVLRMIHHCPPINDIPLREHVKDFPAIMEIPYRKILTWAELFDKYKAKNFFFTHDYVLLLKNGNFQIAEERLRMLWKIPEYEVILMSEHFFSLLYKPHFIKKLVDMVHSGKVIFSTRYVVVGYVPRCHHRLRKLPDEMKLYIAKKLGFSEKDPEFVCLNDVRTNLGINNTRLVIDLLVDYNFTAEQVLGVLNIFRFPYEAVKFQVENLHNYDQIQPYAEWKQSPFIIDIVAYLIEKKTNVLSFTY